MRTSNQQDNGEEDEDDDMEEEDGKLKTGGVLAKTDTLLSCVLKTVLDNLFSGEENLGRYVDLNSLHGEYLNLKGVERLDYIPYLDRFDRFVDIKVYPANLKSSNDYRLYLDHLHNYLHGFFRRSKPLEDVTSLEQQAKLEFEEKWNGSNGGNDQTKAEDATGLFCKACQKLFTKQTVYDAHLKGKKHLKAQEKLEQENGNTNGSDLQDGTNKMDRRKKTAWMEALITAYMKALDNIRTESKANVERKQALTDRERTVRRMIANIENDLTMSTN